MYLRTKLLAAAAATAAIAAGAQAAPAKKHHVTTNANAALMEQLKALREEVSTLRQQVNSQQMNQAEATAKINVAQVQAQQAQAKAEQAQTQVAAVAAMPAPVSKEQVNTQIATAFDKEHHNDKFYFKGITITPGGFLELAGIYRDHFQGNDIASSFSSNFPNARQYAQHEGRFTARQSRVSFLAEGNVNKATKLSMYGEFDFQGAAQTANSNQSDSYNPRIRVLYGTIDWNRGDYGLHLLAGQNWSLLTIQSKGISPRAEVPPSVVDAQYVPGFAWARQPGVRLTGDFLDHKLWLAVAAENPQNNTTTPVGTAGATQVSSVTGGSGFNSLNNNSFNDVPDFIGKAAYEDMIAGHAVHVEGFGIVRTFNERLITGATSGANNSATTFGYGGSATLNIVPKILDVQISGFGGKGIGRYGSAGLPDVAFSSDGRIHPIDEFMLLAGATVHASKQLDVYGYAGEEQEMLTKYSPNFGSIATSNAGCFVEGGACGQNTRRIRQVTVGFWDKFYQGSFGRAQVGIQYSYNQRELFPGAGYSGYPQISNSTGFLSFRYYPF
ncbi:hypothetical protein [Sphingomonas nostoxanthinifaciens]|uniref:hypothetical protein n=1 Tax=Sphingomonas nostoxanthinifaciens TaxID=2872652 RepID=UPI001CC1D701|nr:hypothetical protein [Sphingomonas nostoxanthinifaciens]UAK25175.1 hypothetical protein K8P63_02940 [Sphingomonas nostoxanthinifaciens]